MAEPTHAPSLMDLLNQYLGWITAAIGFLFTSGKYHQRFTQVETTVAENHAEVKELFKIRDEKHEKVLSMHGEMRDLLIELRTDVKHIREVQNNPNK